MALTRAKDRLYVSSVAAPGKKPSKFIDDLLADRVVEARDIERLQAEEWPVIPVKAGIQPVASALPKVSKVDSRFRGNDKGEGIAQHELFGEMAEAAGVHPPIAEWAGREPEIRPGEKLRLSASAPVSARRTAPMPASFATRIRTSLG